MTLKQDEITNVKWLPGTTLITHYEGELITNELVQYPFDESSILNSKYNLPCKNCYNKYIIRTDRDIHFTFFAIITIICLCRRKKEEGCAL